MAHESCRQLGLNDIGICNIAISKTITFSSYDQLTTMGGFILVDRVTEVAKLMMDAGLIVMAAFISPFRDEREMARELIGSENFIEVYIDTPLEVCEKRDSKGLYKKARSGNLPNMTGIDSDYEPPIAPQVTLSTETQSVTDSVNHLIEILSGGPSRF